MTTLITRLLLSLGLIGAATSGAWTMQTPSPSQVLQYTPETPEHNEFGNVDENNDEPRDLFVDVDQNNHANNPDLPMHIAALQAQIAQWAQEIDAQIAQQQQPQEAEHPPVQRRLFE